jgi:hypothetical protein
MFWGSGGLGGVSIPLPVVFVVLLVVIVGVVKVVKLIWAALSS